MAEIPKAQPSAFRQDLLRGIRWGAILLIAMLLGITAYRVLSSSPAVAKPALSEDLAPVPDAGPAMDTAIKVGVPVLKGPDAPPAPELPRPRKTATKSIAPVIEPEHLQAPHFAPLPVAAPAPQPAFAAEPLPEPSPALAPALTVPDAVLVPAPQATAAPADNAKQGNRAVRAVRSVGRLLHIGRKDPESKDEPAKK